MLSLLWCQLPWVWWSKDHDCTLSCDGRPDDGATRSLHCHIPCNHRISKFVKQILGEFRSHE